MLQVGLLVVAGIGVVIALVHLARRPRSRKTSAMIGFARAIARSAGFKKQVSQQLGERSQMIEAARAAVPPTDDEIPGIITWFYQDNELMDHLARILLEKTGSRAIPFLAQALDDPRCTWATRSGDWRSTPPSASVSRLLWHLHDRSLGSRIGHLWEAAHWSTYTIACRARASLGTQEVLPWVLEILGGTGERERKRCDDVTQGIDRAIDQGWADPQFMDGVRSWARTNIGDRNQPISVWAVQFISRHESDAVELLTAPTVLSQENDRNLSTIISELNRLGVPIQQDVLLPIIEKSRASTDSRWQLVLGPALWALAVSNRTLALQIAEQGLAADGVTFDMSLTFLRRICGLPKEWETQPPQGMVLTTDERAVAEHLSHIAELNGEIDNGGIEQYFFNSTGNDWRRHLTSLLAIGLPKSAAALEASAFRIHSDGASTNREQRIKQIAALSDEDLAKLREVAAPILDGEFEVGRFRYMQSHAELLIRIRDERVRLGIDEPEPPFM